MKTAGIIGGIGPESTIEYYRLIIEAYRAQMPDGSYPSIVINSIDLNRVVDLVTANRHDALTDFLSDEVQRLAQAGAECGLLAANTPHIVFDELSRRSPIPLISIVQATCDAAKSLGVKKVGLLGTRFTMEGRFYPDVFSKEGIDLVVPEPDDRAYIHDKYMNELLLGIILPETRQGLLAIVDRMKQDHAIQALILGGTELPLILREGDSSVTFLDTTRIHVMSLVDRMLS